VICTSKSITERIRAEKALRKSEEKYRDLVENISEVIFTVDKNGYLTYVSPAIESILGYSPSEIIGKPFQEIIYKEDLQLVMDRFQKTLAGIKIPTEYRVYKKSGKIRWVHSSSNPISDEKGVCGLQGLLTDIDERKRAEEEKTYLERKLVSSQKMEAIGLLAGGVAHDLNNVLSGVINYPELMLLSLPKESPMRKPLRAILNSGLKAAAIVEATGRIPNLSVLEGEHGKVEHSLRGVIVNEFLQNVSNPRVYAVGDCAATSYMLAPVADEEGKTAARNILEGNIKTIDYSVIPSVVFTIPSIGSVGLTEEKAKQKKLDFRVNQGMTTHWPSSKRIGEEHGTYKILIDNKTEEILGAHIARHNSSEAINVLALAMKYKIKASELAEFMWTYPTVTSDLKYMLK